jgi:gamma-glutamyl phosphate reductase
LAQCAHKMLVKLTRQNEILEINKQDLHEAKRSGLDGAMLARLALTPGKLQALSAGIEQVLNLITLKGHSNHM